MKRRLKKKGKEKKKGKNKWKNKKWGQANIHPHAHVKFNAGVLLTWRPIFINMVILRLIRVFNSYPKPSS